MRKILIVTAELLMLTSSTKSYVGDQSLKISSRPTDTTPEAFGLRSYPNPFSTTTTFEISLPASRPVAVHIFNLERKLFRMR